MDARIFTECLFYLTNWIMRFTISDIVSCTSDCGKNILSTVIQFCAEDSDNVR